MENLFFELFLHLRHTDAVMIKTDKTMNIDRQGNEIIPEHTEDDDVPW